jgi:hypothetical protein
VSSKEPPEWKENALGTGDGVTTTFQVSLSFAPLEPGSVKVYLVPGSLLDKLIAIEDRPPHVFTKKKAPGPEDDVLLVNEITRVVVVRFSKAPERNADIIVRYQWRPPRLRNCKVQVQFPDGHQEWVSMEEFFDVLRGR